MAKFKIVNGSFSSGGIFHRANTDTDIIESDKDLLKHNSKGSIKFVTYDEQAEEQADLSTEEIKSGFSVAELNQLDEASLRELAEGEEIDLGKATSKKAMVKTIMESQ